MIFMTRYVYQIIKPVQLQYMFTNDNI